MNEQATTRHVFSKEQIDEMDTRTIVVTNLDTTATEDDLRKLFDFAGPIKNVEVVFDTRTLMPKGFAFVEFEILLSVEVALIYNQTVFKNRRIGVKEKKASKTDSSVVGNSQKLTFTKPFVPSHPAAKRNSKFVWRAPTSKYAPY
ncbi:hypothetical protein CAEBREN_14285 [Caenorhabditis brenneri]|uniref:RRM domain-containing protein n=1 Tax=Caenorhabditis brenneri TaxID=135651 RepID=G0PB96_CAEBE|nr:hypothetical protein CAEBREN_14285 [Caenorhabditis brenneri]